MCESVVYCSHAHQNDDWSDHRKLCTEVRRCRKVVTDLSHEYSETNGIMDIFDRSNAMVFALADPVRGLGSVGKNYLSERNNLVHAYMELAMAPMTAPPTSNITTEPKHSNGNDAPRPHCNRLAVELALEHCLDLLHLDPVETDSSTRTLVAHCLLVLEQYQELYDYVKYWNIVPWKLRAIKRREPVFTQFDDALDFALGASTFLNFKSPQDMWEDQSQLALRSPHLGRGTIRTWPGSSHSEVVAVLYLALGKLLVHQAIKGIRLMTFCMPIESDLILAHIAGFVGIKAKWLATNPQRARRQCHELLSFANASIPRIIQDLVRLGPDSTSCHLSSLELLRTAWRSHEFPWRFLMDFIEKEAANTCAVPRHELLQHVSDRVYNTYFELKTMHGIIGQIRDHWERAKNSPAGRRLLLEEMENGRQLYELEFCAPRIVSLLRKEGLATAGNVELLLGDVSSISIAAEVEMFLACQHFEQVKYLPKIVAFVQAHQLWNLPPEDVDAQSVRDMLIKLARKRLATEGNLKLLFGTGWPVFYQD
jgi:MYND finger